MWGSIYKLQATCYLNRSSKNIICGVLIDMIEATSLGLKSPF